MPRTRFSKSTLSGLLLAAIAVFVCPAQAQQARDRAVIVDRDDTGMLAAIEHARSTLDSFLALHAHPPAGATGFKLKVRFPYAQGSEYMWVTPFKEVPGGFVGTLADEPRYATDLANGQQVRFTRRDISDWGYVQDGRQKGSFTVCVLFRHMPKAEADAYRRDYHFDC
ncbi:MAG TPA: DUF2314 domain-containing protein [Dyella sp.]|nr:DUF2314 domain-containing protein [Dyella sp.]